MNFKPLQKSKFIRILFLTIAFISASLYSQFPLSLFQKPSTLNFPKTYSLNLNPLNHFRQSLNNCGSYSVSGVLNVFDDKLVDPEKIAASIGFKLQDRFTLPIGLENYLKDQNMKVEISNAVALNENEKVGYLKSQLSKGKAGILLVKIPYSPWYYLHYITVLGYDETDFFVYDSLAPRDGDSKYTVDLNGDKPGNKSILNSKLIEIWDAGNILNYPKNYNLFVKPNK
jgi:hypothetical protein